MLQLKVGLQLSSLRQPFRKGLDSAVALGVNAVEIDARTEIKPSELTRTAVRQIQTLLADRKLSICAVRFQTRRGYHCLDDLDRRVDATKQAMEMAYRLGASVLCNDIGTLPTDPERSEWETMLQVLHDLGRYGQRVGCTLAATTGRQDPQITRKLIEQLVPGYLAIDFDPAELVINGHDVQQAMSQLASHVVQFQARDAVHDFSQGRALPVQLGRGSVDFPPLLAMLEEQKFQGCLTLSQSPETGVQELEHAIQYVRSLWE